MIPARAPSRAGVGSGKSQLTERRQCCTVRPQAGALRQLGENMVSERTPGLVSTEDLLARLDALTGHLGRLTERLDEQAAEIARLKAPAPAPVEYPVPTE